jgi:hypothetical protein
LLIQAFNPTNQHNSAVPTNAVPAVLVLLLNKSQPIKVCLAGTFGNTPSASPAF